MASGADTSTGAAEPTELVDERPEKDAGVGLGGELGRHPHVNGGVVEARAGLARAVAGDLRGKAQGPAERPVTGQGITSVGNGVGRRSTLRHWCRR